MPDHFHWMFAPEVAGDVPKIIGAVKRDVTLRTKEKSGVTESLWQKRHFDHIIRSEDDFAKHLDYIHYNPVKHGYVSRVSAYKHSSFDEWAKRGIYSENWGSEEPLNLSDLDLE